jgi:hypothetical protein
MATATTMSRYVRSADDVPKGLQFQVVLGRTRQRTFSECITLINAYRAGIPGNGKPVPDGAKMAKIQWAPETQPVLSRRDCARQPVARRLHGEGQQEVLGQRRMGMAVFDYEYRDRYFQARRDGGVAATGE